MVVGAHSDRDVVDNSNPKVSGVRTEITIPVVRPLVRAGRVQDRSEYRHGRAHVDVLQDATPAPP